MKQAKIDWIGVTIISLVAVILALLGVLAFVKATSPWG